MRDDYVSPVLYGIIDAIEEAGGDIVYTTATGRRVRRRRSVEAVEGVFVDHQDHGIVSLGEMRTRVAEVSDLFDSVMEMLLDDPHKSKKLQLKNLDKEMDVMVEKLVRNLRQMEKDQAMYQEVEKHMLSVEESHLHDLPIDYAR